MAWLRCSRSGGRALPGSGHVFPHFRQNPSKSDSLTLRNPHACDWQRGQFVATRISP
jgi:hypothetical protein